MSASETKPEFAESTEESEPIQSKPVRDPSLDTLLDGFEDRIEKPGSKSAKVRVHTPPNAQTDPYPEEPVVAAHMTAPLSALSAEARAKATARAASAKGADETARVARHEPTFVVDREPTLSRRGWLVIGACGVAVASALGAVAWMASHDEVSPGASGEAPAASLATALVASPPSQPATATPSIAPATPTASVAPAASAVPSALTKPVTPNKPQKPGTGAAGASSGMDTGLD